ncbi:MAG TPA: hypothetical protein ENK55_02295 [Actinobacteria bacterium]|nr:hypothetical protein [Actinomycetota bacterium]
MKRVFALTMGLLIGAAVAVGTQSSAQADGSIPCWSRTDALSYTYTARWEDYDWGGGWWNDNNVRDTSAHEGPDCSGLTFKSWAMVNSAGNTGRYYWSIGTDIHGPYNSTAFRNGCSGACYDVCGSGTGSACGSSSYTLTIAGDAFAKSGHVAIIYAESSAGWDWFINAAGESYGIQKQKRDYRMQTAYDGIRRMNWSAAC